MNQTETTRTGSLLVFSWGCSNRVERMIQRLRPLSHHVILINPVPGVTQPDILRGDSKVTLIPVIPGTGEDGQSELTGYSLPGLYALSPITDTFAALFPGLEKTSTQTADRIGPQTLKSRLADLARPLHLVIDTPGSEHLVLDTIILAGLIDDIGQISLRCGLQPFFKDAMDAQALKQRLIPHFRLLEEYHTDPDWPEFLFEADALVRQKAKFEDALAEQEEQIKQLSKAINDQEHALKEANVIIDSLTKERDEAQSANNAYSEKLSSAQSDLEKMLRERNTAQESTLKCKNSLANLRSRHRIQLSERDETVKRTEHELEELRLDLRRSLQIQERLQAEVSSISVRCEFAEEERNKLRQLLQQLTPRLREAAQHIRNASLDGRTKEISGSEKRGSRGRKKSSKNQDS